MTNFILTLTFVNILLSCSLHCHAQFNTITRDTLPIRLIGQPTRPERAGGQQSGRGVSSADVVTGGVAVGEKELSDGKSAMSLGMAIGKEGIFYSDQMSPGIIGGEKSSFDMLPEGVTAKGNEEFSRGNQTSGGARGKENFFYSNQMSSEMAVGEDSKYVGKETGSAGIGDVVTDGDGGFHGFSSSAFGHGLMQSQDQRDIPQTDVGQEQQEGKKKSWFRWPFRKSSLKGKEVSRRSGKLFGRKKRHAPQIIIMPVQTVVDDGDGKRERVKIDEYTEDSEAALLFRELGEDDLRRLDLLSQRSTVSMPLEHFYLTSKFGYRRDPLGQGTRFHDGVDLRCSYEPVFAMLPGVVTKVQYGSTGYGNYVVLNHGNIECLYGHLSDIGVDVGEVVQAGDVVAISGNTGRSTGPHLHLKMTYMGQRVDPLVFLDYINGYICQLQSQLQDGSGGTDAMSDDNELTIENLVATMQRYGLHHQNVVLAQALHETVFFTSSVCRNKHNLFGLTRRDGQYYEFATWQDSVKGYRDMIQYRYEGGDYYEFLRQVPYAKDPQYIYKVKHIEGQLGRYGLGLGEGGE